MGGAVDEGVASEVVRAAVAGGDAAYGGEGAATEGAAATTGADDAATGNVSATAAADDAPQDGGEPGHPIRPEFRDACFRQKRKKGKYRLVEPPLLDGPVADTHAHVVMLRDPALELARCALNGVTFVVCMEDVKEPWERTFEQTEAWTAQAAAILPDVRQATLDALDASDAEWAPAVRAAFAERTAGMVADTAACRRAIPRVRIAVGCHPHNASYYDDEMEATLRHLLRDPRVCGLGEVGLDYHYDFSPRDAQREVFRRQIRIAHEAGLPLILHLREAHDEALAIMREEGFPAGGTLLHCFNLDAATLVPWVEAGCHVAIGGPVTFKTFDELRAAVHDVPADRLLTETDSPYMTPEPMRGSLCGPAHTVFTAARLAEELGFPPGEERAAFLQGMLDNARALLDREPTAWQRGA